MKNIFKLQPGEKVTCHTKEEMFTVLTALEAAGCTWINGGEAPTKWLPWEKLKDHTFPDSVNYASEEKGKLKICRGSYPKGKEVIFEGENNENQ